MPRSGDSWADKGGDWRARAAPLTVPRQASNGSPDRTKMARDAKCDFKNKGQMTGHVKHCLESLNRIYITITYKYKHPEHIENSTEARCWSLLS